MKSVEDRIASLSPEQRAMFDLLRKNVKKKEVAPVGQPGPIPRREPGAVVPLSFDQERLWFLFHLDPSSTAYNIDTVTRLEGPLEVPVLIAALNEVVRRHESWRSRFPEIDGKPVQVVAEHLDVPVPVVDLRALPEEGRDELAVKICWQDARIPFDLTYGPLVRSLLVRVREEEYLCFLTVHHIVTDWVSFQLFWRELAPLYVAFREGKPSPLPPVAVQYGDFALWQRAWLSGEALERYVDFWLGEIEGAEHVLELPTDRPRPPAQTVRGASSPIELSPAVSEALRALGRKEGATPFMAVLAAWNALLYRYTGQPKILIGSPNANRNRAEIENLLGFFLTQLVFATDVSGDPSFRELLKRARGTALRAYGHQELPFGKLVEAIRPERDPSRAPLVQVNLLLLDPEYTSFELPGLKISGLKLEEGVSRFDMTLGLWDGSERISGFFEYNLDLFDPATMARMAEAFEALVEGATAEPDRPLSELRLLSEAGWHQVAAEWNDTGVAGGAGTVLSAFEAQVAARPEAVALVFGGEEVSYGELAAAAGEVAGRLRAAGVVRGDCVGLLAERSFEMVAGLLGIWRAGGVFVPLDPGYPAERLGFLLEDTGARVVLVAGGVGVELGDGVRRVEIKEIKDSKDLEDSKDEDERPAAGDLAYVIHTSGTTGQPKGVLVEHGNLAGVLAACRGEFGFGPGDRMPCLAPFSFDIFLFELLAPLTAGGTVELIPLKPALDLPGLLESLGSATRLHAVPALMRQIVQMGPAENRLATVFVGGDAVPADLLEELRATFPGAEVVVLYGPTEGTILAASWLAGSAWQGPSGRRVGTPLGRPLPGVVLRLFDRDGGVPPIGVPGELHIGGVGVTRGYLNRADLAVERFVVREGQRFYRTGDLARHLPDGTLEFFGRADQQVKVRGFRIEPGEIEAALLAQSGITAAVVVAREMAAGDKRLVAYVVPREGETFDVELLRGALGETLPEHMVPSVFVPMAALPLTAHGKVDRKALRAPETSAAPADGGAVAPRGGVEETLAAIWREILGLPAVGVHDNFFQLGGDSILSIQVVVKARQVGLAMTPRLLFEHQTIARLAAVVEPVASLAADQEGEEPIEGDVPLTPVQRQFFARGGEELFHFNDSLLLTLVRPIPPAHLARAFAAVASRHSALRLRFTCEDGGWRQRLAPPKVEAWPFLAVDLGALPEGLRRVAVEAACARLQRGFDLARGPLAVAASFDLGGGPARLFAAAHHLVMDAVSWRILLADLEAAVADLTAGRPVALLPEGTSFARWAQKLAGLAANAAGEAEEAHWREVEAAAAPALPAADLARNLYGSARVIQRFLSPEATEALLRRGAPAYRTEANDLLLAGLALAFARVRGASRILVALESHGRFEETFAGADLSRTVGWFTSIHPVALAGQEDLGLLIRDTKERLRSVPGQGLGYGLLRAATPAAREPWELAFNYLGQIDAALGSQDLLAPAEEKPGAGVSPLLPRGVRLEVAAAAFAGRLETAWSYSEDVDERETIEALAQAWATALEEIAAHCAALAGRGEFGGYTAADFPLAQLTRAEIDELVGHEPKIEDVYPLAPLQGGMLFHSLLSGSSRDYFQQLVATFAGPLDAQAFQAAWQAILDRHPALRTGFRALASGEAMQVVERGVELPWVYEDWRGIGKDIKDSKDLKDIKDEEGLEERLARLLEEDRARGFDFAVPPLLRMTLLRTGEDEHRLLWSFHHLLFDGWCFPLLFREAFTLYEAATTVPGKVSSLAGDAKASVTAGPLITDAPTRPLSGPAEGRNLPATLGALLPPAPSYRTFIAWLAERDHEASEQAFRHQLEGFSGPAHFQGDREGTGAAGPLYTVALSEAETEGLAAAARRLGLTQNTLVQGALALFLGQETGRRDIVFGMVVAGRPAELPGVEGMVGLFINTLPLRVTLPAEQPLDTWLAGIQESQFTLREHEWTPLLDIQRWGGLPPGERLFDTLIAFENYPLDPSLGPKIGSVSIRSMQLVESTGYPLTLTANPGAALKLVLSFDDRFSPAAAGRLGGHFERLLKALPGASGKRLGDLSGLSPEERRQLLELGDGGAAAPSRTAATLAERFAHQVAATPGSTAVIDGETRITYEELARRAGRLAARLAELGVGPEVRVGLFLPRSLDLVVATLAVTQAGGAFVTLDPSYPQDRLAYMLADSAARVLIVPPGVETAPPGLAAEVTLLPADAAPLGTDLPPLRCAAPQNLAYVIYTSGSTGRPKGVAIEHRSPVALLEWAERTFAGDLAVVAGEAAVSFDVWMFELFAPLTTGGTLVILDNLLSLPDHPEAAELTLVSAVPAVMAELLRDHDLPPSVRSVVLGGEVLPRALADRVYAQSKAERVVNAYGPTEDTTYSTTSVVPRGESTAPRIGRPITGGRALLLGADLELAPEGAPAELFLGGLGLARGYFGRPDLTAERFVPHPFSEAPGGRLYRTGDLARYLPGGELEYLGRIDQQVKLRGFRIELSEIEEVAKGHPGVWQAAVVLTGEGDAAKRRLVAFYAPQPGSSVEPAALAAFLKERLPAPMLPAALVALDELPLSPNGKVDRRALARQAEESAGAAVFVAPRNAVEEKLAEIWGELLSAERISVSDDFFALGGHSLLATQLASRLKRELGVEMPIASLFELRTLEEQAREVLQLQLGGDQEGAIDDLMGELEGLSEEEVLALLAAEEEGAP